MFTNLQNCVLHGSVQRTTTDEEETLKQLYKECWDAGIAFMKKNPQERVALVTFDKKVFRERDRVKADANALIIEMTDGLPGLVLNVWRQKPTAEDQKGILTVASM